MTPTPESPSLPLLPIHHDRIDDRLTPRWFGQGVPDRVLEAEKGQADAPEEQGDRARKDCPEPDAQAGESPACFRLLGYLNLGADCRADRSQIREERKERAAQNVKMAKEMYGGQSAEPSSRTGRVCPSFRH